MVCGALLKVLWLTGVVSPFASAKPDNFRASKSRTRHTPRIPASRLGLTPSVADTTENWFSNRIDHLTSELPSGGNLTYEQRFFVYDKYWFPGGPVFFYCGNEADVELYVNATGLMWENAERFGSMLVWAEHRYYGQSQPFRDPASADRSYLSVEQALADYASLITNLRNTVPGLENSAFIAFGGSYGGMLASWMRFKYPNAIDGAIAASAPIFTFEGEDPACDPNFFARGVTYDVSEAGGASTPWCEANFREAFAKGRLVAAGETPEGRAALAEAFQLCAPLGDDAEAGWRVADWLDEALSYMAMGDYPYPSSYILNGDGVLPAFPVAFACDAHLGEDLTAKGCSWSESGSSQAVEGDAVCLPLFRGLAAFAGVYYNNSGRAPCNNLTAAVNPEAALVGALWDYQYCTEIFQLFGQDGVGDLYWPAPWNATEASDRCARDHQGLRPRAEWATETFGGSPAQWARATSNIVWSNGELDPWAGGGVAANLSDTLLALKIPRAAHHLDLMFSDPGDSAEVKAAREFEMAQVRKWIDERAARTQNGN